jgi:hypothetical protein
VSAGIPDFLLSSSITLQSMFKNKEGRKAGKDGSEAFQLSCIPYQ